MMAFSNHLTKTEAMYLLITDAVERFCVQMSLNL